MCSSVRRFCSYLTTNPKKENIVNVRISIRRMVKDSEGGPVFCLIFFFNNVTNSPSLCFSSSLQVPVWVPLWWRWLWLLVQSHSFGGSHFLVSTTVLGTLRWADSSPKPTTPPCFMSVEGTHRLVACMILRFLGLCVFFVSLWNRASALCELLLGMNANRLLSMSSCAGYCILGAAVQNIWGNHRHRSWQLFGQVCSSYKGVCPH